MILEENFFMDKYKHPLTDKERAKLVGQTLLSLRKQVGLLQKDVCEILGISPQTYSTYENGKHEPSMENLVRLAILYDVDTDYILSTWKNVDEGKAIENELGNNMDDNEKFLELQLQMQEMKEQLERITADMTKKENKKS